jgi:hypothetical protein
MRRNKVRGRDGAIREVSDGYVLRDGESQVVELPFMDGSGRTMVTDARGQPAGQRPGFLLSDATDEQARVDAYATYDQAISERWRGPQTKPPSKPPQVFDSPEAAVAAAYLEYADAIQQRWRK